MTGWLILGVIVFLVIIPAVIINLIVKLHRQRQEYQILFESVPCAITVVDRRYRLVRVNREFEINFRQCPEGEYCFRAYKGRDRKCDECPVERTFDYGESCSSEEMRLNRDGSKKYWIVKTAPVRDPNGDIVAAMEMCLDVTPRKLLEEELERSERKYYAIFNNIPNPVFVLHTENHRILDCNKSVEMVYGYRQREIISRSFLDLFVEEEKPHYVFKMNQDTEISQAHHRRKDGRIIIVTVRISPSEYLDHQVLLVTISDITRRLETEQQLSQASKLATLGEMATGIAHELNQPLTVIKMAAGFFMKKIRNDEPIPPAVLTTMCEKINGNVDRANEIINHMRNFARKSSLKLEPVDVNEVLKTAHEIFSQQLKLRQIEVVWGLAGELPPVLAGPRRLEQVFINLLINARDAIEEKCDSMSLDECERKIFLSTSFQRRRVMVEVSDTGTGIPESIADKVFEPFFTTKAVGKGTGLGLSISYGIVRDFKGEIRVGCNAYGGACFQLEFPAWENGVDHRNGHLQETAPR